MAPHAQLAPTTTFTPDQRGRTSLHAAPWRTAGFPGPFPIPCQLTTDEIDYLYWLAAHAWTGHGRVVELGCFLGGSTYALSEGMAARNPLPAPSPRRTTLPSPRSSEQERVEGAAHLLTYDSFITPRGVNDLFTIPVREGESFRPVFERHLARHLSRIDIREGWIPKDLPSARAAEVYPEQDPVEVLFIDCAKQWGVHTTILRAFIPHLIPGRSIVVQQDYKAGLPWLVLHMHQLRRCFEPVHNPAGATLSFRYLGGGDEALASLWAERDLTHAAADEAWRDITEWARATAQPDIILGVELSRSRHLRMQGRPEAGVDALAALADRMTEELGRDPRAPWRDAAIDSWRMTLKAEARAITGAPEHLPRRVANLQRRPMPGDVEDVLDQASRLRAALWTQVAHRLRAEGRAVVALYGAGRHTRDLLATGWPHGMLQVECILDDAGGGREVSGVPVLAPADLPPTVRAILPCSEEHEHALLQAAALLAGSRAGADVAVVPVYSSRTAG